LATNGLDTIRHHRGKSGGVLAQPHWFEYLANDDLVYFQFNGVCDGP
jgi:hypothetical protein